MQTSGRSLIRTLLKSLLDFFYPACCIGCGGELMAHEELLCADCREQLPYIGCEEGMRGNPVFANIAGRVPVLFAAAVFDFKKNGIVQHLLHELKYKGRPEIGVFLGRIAGERMCNSGCFPTPDYIVPVPLHRRKEKKRGYNQSLCIAEGFAQFFPEATIEKDLLEKRSGSESQTRKNRAARWENVKTSFCLSEAALQESRFIGKHFLIVDDVFTTGATVESCARQILKIPDAKVSVVTIASPI